jgi:hypothetical protein
LTNKRADVDQLLFKVSNELNYDEKPGEKTRVNIPGTANIIQSEKDI